jgi:hypothetical protein
MSQTDSLGCPGGLQHIADLRWMTGSKRIIACRVNLSHSVFALQERPA